MKEVRGNGGNLMSGVIVEIPPYMSGVWENASKLFEGLVDFKSNTKGSSPRGV